MKTITTAALAAAFAAILAAPAAMAQDAAAGKTAFKKCEACHTVEAGKTKPTGPKLLGVFGRKVGAGDYKYSDAIQKAAAKGLTWDEKSLDAYIEDPKKFLAGVTGDPKATNKMQFSLKNAAERANIIAYLKTAK